MDALPGPDWLQARRRAALEAARDVPPPTPAEEVWRYSRVDEIDLAGREVVGDPAPSDRSRVDEVVAAVGEHSALVHLVDGHLVDAPGAVDGVEIGPADEAALGELGGDHDHFGLLNDALAAGPTLIRVPAGTVVPAPIVVVDETATPGGLTFPRLVVDAGPDSEVTVVELRIGGQGGALTVPRTELSVGAAARVSSVVLQDLDDDAWQLAAQAASVDGGASFTSAVAAFGGEYARLRSDCRLAGRGASGVLLAAYLGVGDQMLDFRTFQDHAAPDTTSELLFKGALGDTSRSVYTGLIRVRPDARGTDAFQTNRNLKLSEDAWAESVPNLEIENNEVRCSHASTVGPVDEEQRFYLGSRGVPPVVADELIVAGFFDEVLSRLPGGVLADRLSERIATDLHRSLA